MKVAVKSFANAVEYRKLVEMLDPNKIVSVYKNLHTGLWSIVQSGRVVCHADYIILRDVKFTVRPAGRAKVLKEKKKNVHAFVKGYICSRPSDIDRDEELNWQYATYNPYKYDHFYNKHTHEPIKTARFVDMCVHAKSKNMGEPVMAAI